MSTGNHDDEHDEGLCLSCAIGNAVSSWMDRAEASGDPELVDEASNIGYHLSAFTDWVGRLMADYPPELLDQVIEVHVRNLRKIVADFQAKDKNERPPGTALQ